MEESACCGGECTSLADHICPGGRCKVWCGTRRVCEKESQVMVT